MSDITVMGHYHTWVRLNDGREFDIPDEIHVPTNYDMLCFSEADTTGRPSFDGWLDRHYEVKGEH